MNKSLSILLVCFIFLSVNGQITGNTTPVQSRNYHQTTGLIGYYFWEENESGWIDSVGCESIFLLNKRITLQEQRVSTTKASSAELQSAIKNSAHNQKWNPENRYYFYRLFHRKQRKVFRLLNHQDASVAGSVVFRKQQDSWISEEQQSVLYFTIDSHQQKCFSHSSDSLILPDLNLAIVANGLYQVNRFQSANGTIDSSQVLTFNGIDVTDSLRNHQVNKPVRMLVLINGYRGPKTNNDPGDGLLTQKDRFYYWYQIDSCFEANLKPEVLFYLDGSFPISTSNHRSKLIFGISWLRTKLTPSKKTAPRVYKRMNTRANESGFMQRKEEGRLAGETYLLARSLNPFSQEVKDTLDIVSHSMGYAYSLGFLEVIKDKVILGNMYILAPENAGIEGFDWTAFQHTWQYGSDLDQKNPAPLREQDGIAPQCAVKGIDQLPPDRGGRVFIPADWPNKNFVDSHMIYSYDWIFECIPVGQPGYISRR